MTVATPRSLLQRTLTRAWTRRGPLAWLLWPISLLFVTLAALRRHLYQAGLLKVRRVRALVIVVGNVVAGGSGKTPVVMALVRHLQARGLRVGVISRGYGRRATNCREVFDDSLSSEVGDEPALIRRATSAPVFVAARRFDAASALLARYPDTQVILCDDGLQHLGLHRDLEICVFDDRGTGNGLLLPAGPLREPWPRAADLVLHTGARPAFAGFTAVRTLARHALRADGSQIALANLVQAGAKPLLAVAAIAKPEDFFAMLQSQDLPLARTIALPDHYDFDSWLRNEYEGYTVICTEKDAVKLWLKQPDALAVPLIVTPEPAFMARLDDMLSVLLASRLNPKLSSTHGHTTS
ncbi:MAG: tetraacyldisaccharide 4'-kinase [Rhodoferax sp.]|uniref:tetraacyldisaccharide 4'-kinase n=1 Tax=Rhodoferax sp. TaxID=50421 RepID=UPI0027157E40|nr:tetraacyldisaccharide 4'-kinase [Rhodoferax sp.]MDO8447600.1 tetraacyldisaccharide 4'-kinase [Rhodoferax sp.]